MKKTNIYSISAMIIIVDQLVKLLIKNNMYLTQEITIIPNFFSLFYLQNEGAAFGLFSGATVMLVLIGFIVLIYLARYIERNKINKLEGLTYGLILGGIIGNLIDRLLHHAVIDYLQFMFGDYRFAVFNIADIAIVVGAGLLTYDLIKNEIEILKHRRKLKKKKAK